MFRRLFGRGQDPPRTQVLGQNHEGSVCEVHRKIAVFLHELLNPRQMTCSELENPKRAVFGGVDESELGGDAEPGGQEMAGLGHDRPR